MPNSPIIFSGLSEIPVVDNLSPHSENDLHNRNDYFTLGWNQTDKFPSTNNSAATASEEPVDLFKILPFLVVFQLICIRVQPVLWLRINTRLLWNK